MELRPPESDVAPVQPVIEESIEDAKQAGLKYVHVDEPGISRRKRGRGFEYLDAQGHTVRDRATLKRIQAMVIPPAWVDVWICPRESGHIQVMGRDAKGRKQYLYHAAYREARDLKKFDHAVEFGSLLPKIRETLEADLSLPGLPKRKVMALMVQLLDRTALRVGNTEYAKKNGSYGLTTLQNKHVQIHGPDIRLHFRAKSGVVQEIALSDRKLAKLLERTKSIRGSDLFQYVDEVGEQHSIQAADINEYLRDIAGENVTAKDFRTWHGTVQMLMELCVAGPAKSATDAKKRLSTAVKATASRLGNRPATCRGYYIHPEVIERYMSQRLFEGFHEKRMPETFEECESALLTLLPVSG